MIVLMKYLGLNASLFGSFQLSFFHSLIFFSQSRLFSFLLFFFVGSGLFPSYSSLSNLYLLFNGLWRWWSVANEQV